MPCEFLWDAARIERRFQEKWESDMRRPIGKRTRWITITIRRGKGRETKSVNVAPFGRCPVAVHGSDGTSDVWVKESVLKKYLEELKRKETGV